MDMLLQLVLLLDGLGHAEKFQKLDQAANPSDLHVLKVAEGLAPSLHDEQKARQNGDKVDPEPALEVRSSDVFSGCQVPIGGLLIDASVEADNDFNEEDDVDDGLEAVERVIELEERHLVIRVEGQVIRSDEAGHHQDTRSEHVPYHLDPILRVAKQGPMDISPVLVLPVIIVFLLILFNFVRVDRATLNQHPVPSFLRVPLLLVSRTLQALVTTHFLFLSIIVIQELCRHIILTTLISIDLKR